MGRVGEIVDFCICRPSGSNDSGDVVCCVGPSLHLYFYSSVFSSGFNVSCSGASSFRISHVCTEQCV